MTPSEQSNRDEREMGIAANLVAEVVDGRHDGDRDEVKGHADDDLLGAVEALEDAIRAWHETRPNKTAMELWRK